MPLERRVRWIVDLLNKLQKMGPQEELPMAKHRVMAGDTYRRLGWMVVGKGPKAATEIDHMVPVEGGAIRVRIYTPHEPGPWPLYVFLHGGGWCIGNIEERDSRCREVVVGARCAVASVEYRLAPENAYPIPAEDTYAALVWCVEHAEELNIDPERVAIGGESAGANLAAVACLMARDRSGPKLVHQWLDVPATDLTMSQPAFREIPDGYLLDTDIIMQFRECYLGDVTRDTEPYASPLLAEDHSDLPPAWVMSCEFDKLRDDGRAYADKLTKAGVPTTYRLFKGHCHPTFALTRALPSAKAYERDAIAALSKALHP